MLRLFLIIVCPQIVDSFKKQHFLQCGSTSSDVINLNYEFHCNCLILGTAVQTVYEYMIDHTMHVLEFKLKWSMTILLELKSSYCVLPMKLSAMRSKGDISLAVIMKLH